MRPSIFFAFCDLPDLRLLAALLRFSARRPERIARRRTQAWQVSIGDPLLLQTAPGRLERRKGAKRAAASLSGDRAIRRGRNEREEISRRARKRGAIATDARRGLRDHGPLRRSDQRIRESVAAREQGRSEAGLKA